MPQEYWINVYKYGFGCLYYSKLYYSKEDAVAATASDALYRLHVKLKGNYKCQ